MIDETVVYVRKGDYSFNTDTILTSRLEDATHENAGYALEVAVGEIIKNDGWVFAT